ncbi:class I SAM-dependent methyltransferase [Cohnella endophytica]|uniref:Class I SAM-dependent methyltransferase n=1 Tax=Cohnella endophytica TaxID=2419778 RepID=A0A494XPJ5_9BACL|nr:class I SAM-dependent methyltransferase [Cohnella endophytica]RKP51641.1 class I SAM-dependent methyltransferase [Cohnella endophytica]
MTEPDHDKIYRQEALQYHELIAKQPELSSLIDELCPIDGLDVVDMGAGTGRLSVALAPRVRSLVALDASEAMLRITADRLRSADISNWKTAVADHRKLPLADHRADLVVSGWSICYLASSNDPDWERNLAAVIGEIRRVLRPGGTAIIFETMGTGFETPHPPDFLRSYYAALERDYGFSHRWIRTDYEFDDIRQAEQLSRFFFGDELADKVVRDNLVRLPECAGVWWRLE